LKENKRGILVIAIAIVVVAAVFLSFGLPALTGKTPQVTLLDISAESDATDSNGLLPIQVTPGTVQSVIASLSRPESYSRTLTVTLFWNGGSTREQVQSVVDGDYSKTTIKSAGGTENRICGDGTLYFWYAGDKNWTEKPFEAAKADQIQHIPTYETLLELDVSYIVEAGYQQKDGRDCVYLGCRQGERVDRYWVETATGLLQAAETYENDVLVYQMAVTSQTIPLEKEVKFTLPDGTVLHTAAVEKE